MAVTGRWRIGLVGPGRAGTVVAAGLARAGHRVVAVAGGSAASRQRLGGRLPTARSVGLEQLRFGGRPEVDLVVLAVPDDALEQVVGELADAGEGSGRRVTHLSGAMGRGVLAPLRARGWRSAATHPAVTFPDPMAPSDVLVGMPWGVTAKRQDLGWATQLVQDTGGDAVEVAERDRATYHAGLAIASNAVAAAVAAAMDVLVTAGVREPERLVGPLAAASVQAALEGGAGAITGPVARGDAATLHRHLVGLDQVAGERWQHAMGLVLAVVGDRLDEGSRAAVARELRSP